MLHQTEVAAAGHWGEVWGGRGRPEDHHQSSPLQNPCKFRWFLHYPVSGRGKKVRTLSPPSPSLSLLNLCRAWFYCKACHEDVKDENLIKKCKCKHCKYERPNCTFAGKASRQNSIFDLRYILTKKSIIRLLCRLCEFPLTN